MSNSPPFPVDGNGAILRRLYDAGDDLSKARIIDFCFKFRDRRDAIAFAASVEDQDAEVCISFYKERGAWQTVVKRKMVPEHGAITEIEAALASKAATFCGTADGWGCLLVQEKL